MIDPATEEIVVVAKMDIDNDGRGPSQGDPDHQNQTTYKPDLVSQVDKYAVVPPEIRYHVHGIVMGCYGYVINRVNQKKCEFVVGDEGPSMQIGEVSEAVATAVGVNPSPTEGGDKTHLYEYHFFPGRAAVVDGKTYTLQHV